MVAMKKSEVKHYRIRYRKIRPDTATLAEIKRAKPYNDNLWRHPMEVTGCGMFSNVYVIKE